MCGILVKLSRSKKACPELQSSLSRLRHRGPDRQGIHQVQLPDLSVELGMARLKIVDLSDIEVPFHFPYLGVSLAYNGEVYNHLELRSALSDGTPWLTRCDAEVLARAWRRWGIDCPQRLNGMWAFVLVDEWKREVFISRDRLGKKPLYIYEGPNPEAPIYLASEPKAIPAPQVPCSCEDIETLEYDIGPSTPIRNLWQLPPASFIHLESGSPVQNLQQNVHRFWDLPPMDAVEPDTKPFEDSVEEAQALIVDAVRIRAVSEVPLAVFLSGGLDSAIIQKIVQAEKTYCVTFPEIDNLSDAQKLDPGAIPIRFGAADLKAAMPDVLYHLDTPATWSAVCLWFTCRKMHSDGIRVALSGEGADEAFGGYSRYALLYWLEQAWSDPRLKGYQPTVNYLLGSPHDLLSRMLCRGKNRTAKIRSSELIVAGKGLLDSAQRTEIHSTMQVLLRMADRMSMAHSIETRNPFLDHRLIELGLKLPLSHRVTGTETKAVLRAVGRRLGVPKEITDSPTKRGLAIPWTRWKEELGLSPPAPAPNGRPGRDVWDRSAFATWSMELFLRQAEQHPVCPRFQECHGLRRTLP